MKTLKLMALAALMCCSQAIVAITQADFDILKALNRNALKTKREGNFTLGNFFAKETQVAIALIIENDQSLTPEQVNMLTDLQIEALNIETSLIQ